MSVDPSSIPSFGGQPRKQGQGQSQEGQGRRKKPAGPIKPNQDLVKQLLEQMKLKFVTDKQGDLVAPWQKFRTHFMFRGEEKQQIFSVRTFYDRQHSIEEKPQLLETINDWNRRTLWPKMYTHTHDDGTVRLIGEAQMLVGTGVALDHFVTSTVSWIRASIEFDKWLVQELGLAMDVESSAQDPMGGDTPAAQRPEDGDVAAEGGNAGDSPSDAGGVNDENGGNRVSDAGGRDGASGQDGSEGTNQRADDGDTSEGGSRG